MGGEGADERTAVSLSTVLLSPPSATLVSSVCLWVGQQALVAKDLCALPVSDSIVNVCVWGGVDFSWSKSHLYNSTCI